MHDRKLYNHPQGTFTDKQTSQTRPSTSSTKSSKKEEADLKPGYWLATTRTVYEQSTLLCECTVQSLV